MPNLSVRSLLCLLVAGLLLTGCASVKYQQDYKPGADFGQYQSFGWRNGAAEDPEKRRLQRLTQTHLEQMGYRFQPNQPDLWVDITALTRLATGGSTGIGLSVGLPVGRSGAIGVGGSRALDNQKQEGVILVDFTERQSNTLVWRGSAEAIPLRQFALGAEDQLSQVLQRLLAQFPPR